VCSVPGRTVSHARHLPTQPATLPEALPPMMLPSVPVSAPPATSVTLPGFSEPANVPASAIFQIRSAALPIPLPAPSAPLPTPLPTPSLALPNPLPTPSAALPNPLPMPLATLPATAREFVSLHNHDYLAGNGTYQSLAGHQR